MLVMPAKAGIQFLFARFARLDSGVRRNDEGAIFPLNPSTSGERCVRNNPSARPGSRNQVRINQKEWRSPHGR
jgi:hypothetical protein